MQYIIMLDSISYSLADILYKHICNGRDKQASVSFTYPEMELSLAVSAGEFRMETDPDACGTAAVHGSKKLATLPCLISKILNSVDYSLLAIRRATPPSSGRLKLDLSSLKVEARSIINSA
jgi:hypothetical protein